MIEDATPTTTEDTSKFHKHHDLIIAWAKGAKIQYFSDTYNEWKDINTPSWGETEQYRIKPKVTYSVGQKFYVGDKFDSTNLSKFVLCSPQKGHVVLINTKSGLRVGEMKPVKNLFEITEKELELLNYNLSLVE